MIFVTTGVQLPFDRLIQAVDEWAIHRLRSDIIAQVGKSSYSAQRIEVHAFLTSEHFSALVKDADFIVAHAGMGSLITAMQFGKPIIVMPRLASLNEHRNDHQLNSAEYMRSQGIAVVAKDARDLHTHMDEMVATYSRRTRLPSGTKASTELLGAISKFVDDKYSKKYGY